MRFPFACQNCGRRFRYEHQFAEHRARERRAVVKATKLFKKMYAPALKALEDS